MTDWDHLVAEQLDAFARRHHLDSIGSAMTQPPVTTVRHVRNPSNGLAFRVEQLLLLERYLSAEGTIDVLNVALVANGDRPLNLKGQAVAKYASEGLADFLSNV